MGLQDRDYMKRRPGDDADRSRPPDARLDAFLSGFLSRHPRFLMHAGVCLAAIVIVAILVAIFADQGR